MKRNQITLRKRTSYIILSGPTWGGLAKDNTLITKGVREGVLVGAELPFVCGQI